MGAGLPANTGIAGAMHHVAFFAGKPAPTGPASHLRSHGTCGSGHAREHRQSRCHSPRRLLRGRARSHRYCAGFELALNLWERVHPRRGPRGQSRLPLESNKAQTLVRHPVPSSAQPVAVSPPHPATPPPPPWPNPAHGSPADVIHVGAALPERRTGRKGPQSGPEESAVITMLGQSFL